ncbi:Rqc2 family fibronectin-binding protein [Gemella sanguinis]|uniref:Rqc2 family fibronectin-binding protein n=1 Tax=Gemella sanguinis TaxID=84135 RepID=UPI0008075ED7|nr:NFACT RNA binding domain-containing protein [Gemella sanguinis]
MAFDGFFVRKLVEEFNKSILYSRINKINNLSNDEFIFSIRKGKNLKLYVSANSSASRIQLTNNSYENPQTPSNFCSVLRKYLMGGIIEEINQINNDRIIKFKIKNFDELGYEKYYFLITELMGKHSNIILTNSENIIIESLKNSYSLEFSRSTISNMEYVLPPTVKKYNPFNFSEYSDLKCDNNDKKFLIKNFYGVSSVLNNYFLNKEENVLESFKEFCSNFSSYNEPTLLKNGNKNDFYYFDIISNKDNIKFDSLSRLLDFYYMDIQKESSNKNTEKELFNFIKNKLSRLNKKLKILNKELLEAKEKDDYKLKGQLLISNIYLFKNNIPEVVTLQNFYSENLEDISIELDPNISIEKNSEKYFELYKKNKRTIENLYEQIDITKKDISYFETLSFQIENAGKTDLLEIKEELINSGYLKKDKNKKNTKKKNNYLIIKYNGIDIYVGKNNIQNDTITNKLARRDYLWFHAKDIPGSHVVIFDNNPDEETKRVASMLAGYFSKFKNENYVSVDSTLIKNVKKISGAKPGMVTYTDQKTVKQKIDKIFINELLVNNN